MRLPGFTAEVPLSKTSDEMSKTWTGHADVAAMVGLSGANLIVPQCPWWKKALCLAGWHGCVASCAGFSGPLWAICIGGCYAAYDSCCD
jgi:hypothetical protein